DGDTFAGLIREHRLGAVVPPEDADALAAAIEDVLYGSDRARTAHRVRELGETFAWSRALRPLIDFCVAPRQAADRRQRSAPVRRQARRSLGRLRHTSFWRFSEPLRVFIRKLIPGR